MGLRSLVSFGLIAIPIGATLGILLGLDAHRSATGQSPLFQDDTVSINTYCQKAYGITPPSTGQQYTCKSILLARREKQFRQKSGITIFTPYLALAPAGRLIVADPLLKWVRRNASPVAARRRNENDETTETGAPVFFHELYQVLSERMLTRDV